MGRGVAPSYSPFFAVIGNGLGILVWPRAVDNVSPETHSSQEEDGILLESEYTCYI